MAQHRGADLELAVVGPPAGEVEGVLEIPRLGQRPGQFPPKRLGIRRGIEETRRQHRIEQDRMAA